MTTIVDLTKRRAQLRPPPRAASFSILEAVRIGERIARSMPAIHFVTSGQAAHLFPILFAFNGDNP